MAYKVEGPNGDGRYEVINSDTGDVKSDWPTEEEASDQVKILHDIEKRMAENGTE